jgi:SSS family solute:Na+ symporter
MLRFPLVLSYCFLGVCLGAYATAHPEFITKLPLNASGGTNYNLAVPVFVIAHFPHGLIGLVMVGLFAAAMSSLDSTLNALSALSMQDIVKKLAKREFSARNELLISKLLTIFWGAVCLFFAFFVADVSQTIIESVNKIGSLINGPLLAVFLMGMLTQRVNGKGALIGLITGFSFNVVLWKWAPDISWLWWNVIGFLTTYIIGYACSLAFPAPAPEKLADRFYNRPRSGAEVRHQNWRPYYFVLAAYGMGILFFLVMLSFYFN